MIAVSVAVSWLIMCVLPLVAIAIVAAILRFDRYLDDRSDDA